MKMNVVDDLVIGGKETIYTGNDPTPDAIGLEFVRQYYTLLADSPGSVHKFYSHESVFVHNDVTVVGQQRIKNTIEQLVEANSRFKIHTVKGSYTSNKGIVLQVCGEVATRRFFQTFILGQQSAKKFYVQNDIFQFVDVAFRPDHHENPIPSVESDSAVKPLLEENFPVVQNGHSRSHPNETSEKSVNIETPAMDRIVPVIDRPVASSSPVPSVVGEIKDLSPKANLVPKKDESPTKKDEVNGEPEIPPNVDSSPKTWAKLVGGTPKSSSQSIPIQQSVSAPKPQPSASRSQASVPRGQSQINGISNQVGTQHQNERRIYLGNIVRNIVPDSTGTAEQEIKAIFSRYGEVDTVAIPRKVLDQPNDTSRNGFAFITMRTVNDAQNVFKVARKDDRGVYHLPLKVDSFGFEGEATISDQRDRASDRSGGSRGVRGGFSTSRPFSAFVPRGRGGRSFRGGYQNQH